jgi:hypothetical protein
VRTAAHTCHTAAASTQFCTQPVAGAAATAACNVADATFAQVLVLLTAQLTLLQQHRVLLLLLLLCAASLLLEVHVDQHCCQD